MGLFSFSKSNDINQMVAEKGESTILVDVREQDEYASGHIPGAVNFPLSTLDRADLLWSVDTSLYVYCLSGARSGRAVQFLRSQGYTNVTNIGGINSWRGGVEKV